MTQIPDPPQIGSLPITPSAEPNVGSLGAVTSKDENDFYKKGGQEYDLRHNQQNLGWLGKFFGASLSAPTNIAGFVIICAFAFLVGSFWFPFSQDIIDLRKTLLGLISSALSFIFGAASKK